MSSNKEAGAASRARSNWELGAAGKEEQGDERGAWSNKEVIGRRSERGARSDREQGARSSCDLFSIFFLLIRSFSSSCIAFLYSSLIIHLSDFVILAFLVLF